MRPSLLEYRTKISTRYLVYIIPILLTVFVALSYIFFNIERNIQYQSTREFNEKILVQANKTLQYWIDDQLSTVRLIAADPRVIEACSDPTNPELVNQANMFLRSVQEQNKFYENIALSSNLPANFSFSLTAVDGKSYVIKRGNFFADSSKGASIGKSNTEHPMAKAIYHDNKDHIITHVYRSLIYGNPAFIISVPVKKGDKLAGAVHMALPMSYFTDKFINEVKIGDTGYLFMIDDKGLFISHPEKDWILNDKKTEELQPLTEQIVAGKGAFNYSLNSSDYQFVAVPYDFKNLNHINNWYLVFAQQEREIVDTAVHFIVILLGALLLSCVIISIAVYVMTNVFVTKPLEKLGASLIAIADNGDLTNSITINRTDEIGKLADSVNTFVGKLRNTIADVWHSFDRVLVVSDELASSSTQIQATADQLFKSIHQVAGNAQTQSTHTEGIQSMIETVENQLEAGNAQMAQSVTNAQVSTELANEGKRNVESATAHLNDVNVTVKLATEHMEQLGNRSNEIKGMVEIISQLAGQTNLLALNASIEAARAGEAGRGFAVVADEVKKLAEQSANAANQIAELTNYVQQDTEQSIAAMQQTNTMVNHQVSIIEKCGQSLMEIVNKAIDSENDARQTQDIFLAVLNGTKQVLANTQQIAEIIKTNSNSTLEAASSVDTQTGYIKHISTKTVELNNLAEEVKNKVSHFKI